MARDSTALDALPAAAEPEPATADLLDAIGERGEAEDSPAAGEAEDVDGPLT